MPAEVLGTVGTRARPVLWRITDRTTFVELRRRGRRVRSGPLSVTWLAPDPHSPTAPPRAGFAIGKAVGGAVVRNRVRRRLRAALRDLCAEELLPPGSYLLGATAIVATMPWSTLVEHLRSAVEAVHR